MKKALSLILALVLVLSVFAGCGNSGSKATYSNDGKVFHIYAWNEEFKGFFEKYYQDKIPEGVEVKWTINPNEGGVYQQKLDEALLNQANAEEPIDMFLAEADYILKYTDSEYTMDVSLIGVTDFSNAYQYTVDAASANGVVKGVSFQCCPAALIYRRSIAKDVLGTDDPAQVQAALSDWAKFDAVAAQAKEKGYYMTASYAETYRTFSNNTTSAWTDADNNLVIDAQIKAYLTQAKSHMDNGYTLPAGVWDEEKNVQMFADGKTMCFFGPAWYYNFCMGNAMDPEKGCSGDWAICQGPQAYFWGGTWLLAANGTDNADIVADCMNAFINDEEVCTNLVKNEMQFSNNQKVNQTVAEDPTYGNAFLGGQNDTAVFVELAKNIKFEYKTKYDQLLNENITSIFLDYFQGNITEEQAYANFYQYVKEQYPAINVPEA